jgi:hypothetical protein
MQSHTGLEAWVWEGCVQCTKVHRLAKSGKLAPKGRGHEGECRAVTCMGRKGCGKLLSSRNLHLTDVCMHPLWSAVPSQNHTVAY